jgi:hypothetical protein
MGGHSGTATIVDLGEGAFLLTAAHVLTAALARRAEPQFHFVAGPQDRRRGRRATLVLDCEVAIYDQQLGLSRTRTPSPRRPFFRRDYASGG